WDSRRTREPGTARPRTGARTGTTLVESQIVRNYIRAPTFFGFRRDGNAGAAYRQLGHELTSLGPDRASSCGRESARRTPEVGECHHHHMLHRVPFQFRRVTVELGGDDEHACQIRIRAPVRSLLRM